jgi:hypothetical protein
MRAPSAAQAPTLIDSMGSPHGTTPDPRREPRPGHISAAAVWVAVSLFVLALIAAGCAKAPLGPPFEKAPPPPDHRGRLYVYRSDQPGSLASIRITVNGLEIGRFRNNEYETIELPTGSHHLRAGLRGFGLLAWGWNSHRFLLAPGETAYLEISVRLAEHGPPAARDSEIPGRSSSGAVSENVFIIRQSAETALSDLETTTRLARPAATEDP